MLAQQFLIIILGQQNMEKKTMYVDKKSFVQKYDKKEKIKMKLLILVFYIEKFLNFFLEKSKNYSFESDFLIKAIELKN